MEVSLDVKEIHGFAEAMAKAPELLTNHLVEAFQKAGSQIQEQLRQNLATGLNIKAKGSAKTFKVKSSDAARVKGNMNKVFLDAYNKWKGAKIFETGGTITPKKAGALMVLTDNARGPGGKRRWSQEQIRAFIASGEFKMIKAHGKILIIRERNAALTKTGKHRKGYRTEIIAVLVRGVHEPKRLDFAGIMNRGHGLVTDLAEVAVEQTNMDLAAMK